MDTATKPQIEQVNVADLVPYARNSRTHSDEQVAQIMASIREFGFTNPVLIDEASTIIAGHGRVMAASRMNLDAVPCLRLVHLTEAQKRAYVIADNRLALNAEWDSEQLANELIDLHADDFDLGLLGFEPDELSTLMGLDTPSGDIVEDEIPEPPADPITKPGDLWILGEHRLLCGDSTKAEDVARLMDGQRADLCFTSPPYSDQRTYDGTSDLSPQRLSRFIDVWAGHCETFAVNLGIARKGGFVDCYWNEYISAATRSGMGVISWNVWHLTGGYSIGQLTAMFPIEHEFIFIFGKKTKKLIPTIPNGAAGLTKSATDRDAGGTMSNVKHVPIRTHRELGTVFDCVPVQNNADHPAQFPLELPAAYIASFTGDVCEPFCGSGTTLIAAEQLGRKCYGMEISPQYCDVIVKRWENLTGNVATLEEK